MLWRRRQDLNLHTLSAAV